MPRKSALSDWTPEQIERGRAWVAAWKLAATDLERIRRRELREMNVRERIALLYGDSQGTQVPPVLRESSGLVEQQWWFMRAARNR